VIGEGYVARSTSAPTADNAFRTDLAVQRLEIEALHGIRLSVKRVQI
jgi:hypothetical protein